MEHQENPSAPHPERQGSDQARPLHKPGTESMQNTAEQPVLQTSRHSLIARIIAEDAGLLKRLGR